MSSSCQSQAREFMGEKRSGGETLRFSGNAAPGVAEVGSPKCRGLEREFDLHVKMFSVPSSPGFGWSSPQCQRSGNVGRFCATLLLCKFATGCGL